MTYFYSVQVNNQVASIYRSEQIISANTLVVVETIRGTEVGLCSNPLKGSESFKVPEVFRYLERVATPEDIKDYESNKNRASTFLPLIRNLISKHNLEMKIVDIAFTLDTTKIMIIYASEERVDFRELLRDLAVLLKCRIDLKQIAPRDRAKIIGGVGICGLILCCSRILSEFDSINMKYIRNQNLAYDIAKLSGPCGKLICCLKFEDEYYTEFRESLPKINDIIRYNGRNVKVVGYNVLKRQVKLSSFNGESEEIIFVPASELDGSNKQ